MTPNVLAELQGLQALARCLVHGDAEADDLVQDAAVATLEHPPEEDRPVRPWLATVIRNRWRMNHRAEARRRAREQAAAALVASEGDPSESIDRARVLQRLSEALVALDEPLRQVVVRRYLDGLTAAQIARELGIPPGTVRWRLKTALERLRAALDTSNKRSAWMRALVPLPLKGVAFVKTKTKVSLAGALLGLLLLGGIVWFAFGRSSEHAAAPVGATASASNTVRPPAPVPPTPNAGSAAAPHAPSAGQARATVETLDPKALGVVSGRVINWSTGAGVPDAELTFTADDDGAYTVRSDANGSFELAPPHAGELLLTTVTAKGFLPFAPEYLHSSIRVQVMPGHAVRGVTVFAYPAVDYHGHVVENGAPVPNARVRLLGTPAGEQRMDQPATEWTTDAHGEFTFHAADDAILEATAGDRRGWARLDGNVAISKQLVIELARVPARDATITGHLVDSAGHGIAEALVRADPAPFDNNAPRASTFAVTGPDGAFELRDVDRGQYVLEAEAEDHAPVHKAGIAGGTKDVKLVAKDGVVLAGNVTTTSGDPVPAFTLQVFWRQGVGRRVVIERSIVDARGHFEVRVDTDSYELVASAPGWAPSPRITATAPAKDVSLVISEGATLSGTVVSSVDHKPIGYARVMPEGRGGGASAQPANAGTVTRDDGTFELTGLAPGPLSITIGAHQFNPKIEAGFTATDGGKLGPVTIELVPLAPGEEPKLDLVGIGVALAADGDALKVQKVFPGGGAAEVGIAEGEHIVAVDGAGVVELGMEGAIERIRGQPNTTVAIGLRRGDQVVTLAVPRRKLHV